MSSGFFLHPWKFRAAESIRLAVKPPPPFISKVFDAAMPLPIESHFSDQDTASWVIVTQFLRRRFHVQQAAKTCR
jgi:hypothetical protein